MLMFFLMMDRVEEFWVEGVVLLYNLKWCLSDGWYWKGGGEEGEEEDGDFCDWVNWLIGCWGWVVDNCWSMMMRECDEKVDLKEEGREGGKCFIDNRFYVWIGRNGWLMLCRGCRVLFV